MSEISHRKSPARVLAALCLIIALAISGAAPAQAQESSAPIPWKPGLTFTRTSVDDDIRNVLRTLLAADGLSAIFQPGVEGKVSFTFKNLTAQAAFDQLVQENGLRASFNPATQTVTVEPGSRRTGMVSRFITLQNVDWPSLRQMLVNFGLGTDGIAFDPATSMLGVTGDQTRVAQVEDLVKTLEAHYGTQQERALDETRRTVRAQRSDLERRAYEDALNVQTRVFRLRFADVGPTTRQFHGHTVTVPGILETLQAMLGTNAPPPPAVQQGQSNVILHPPPTLGQLLQNTGSGPGPAPPGAPGAADPPERPLSSLQAIGRPAISIDQRTNSVIVRGSPAAIAAVEDVIRQLDQPVKMIEIEVVIATAEKGVADELGVMWRGGSNTAAVDSGSTGGQGGIVQGFNPVTLLPLASTPQSAVGSFVVHGAHAFLQAQIQALADKNKARVLSAPHLVTLDNVTARITRSEDIYVPIDGGALNGQSLGQIQTGLTLEITPSIVPAGPTSSEHLVRLSLDAVNSAPGSGTGNQIFVNSQEVQTDVLVPDGGTFVVGGLFDDTRLQSQSGIPLLKDIPLLGHLFRDDASQTNLGETIFFITPRVVDEREVLSRDVALGEDTVAYISQERHGLADMSREIEGMRPQPAPASAIEEDE